jgi:hypothetical protein
LFHVTADGRFTSLTDKFAEKLSRDLSTYKPELVTLARIRVQYLKEIDRQQPIAITPRSTEPLIRSVSERINDTKPLAGAYSRETTENGWLEAGTYGPSSQGTPTVATTVLKCRRR